MTYRWLLIALLIVAGRPAQAAVDAATARAKLVAAICTAGDPATIATASPAVKPITFYSDGTVDPAGVAAWQGRQLSFNGFQSELIVRIAVATKGKDRVIACGAVGPPLGATIQTKPRRHGDDDRAAVIDVWPEPGYIDRSAISD